MPLTYTDYVNAVKAKTRDPICRLEILDSNEKVINSLTPALLDGTLSLTLQNGSRRTCSILLNNTDGSYIPDVDYLWVNSKFRLWTGLKIGDEEYLVSRGIFVLSQPEINSFFSEKSANLNLVDKWAMLDGTLAGTLKNDYIIAIGTNVGEAIKAIFQEAGEVKTPIIDPIDIVTPYTLTKSAGDTYADLLIEIAQMCSWDIYFDKNGYPRFKPPTDVDKSGSVWDFTTENVTYLGSSRKYDFTKIKNTCKILGDNINGSLVSGLSQDTNANSQTRVSLIGERVLFISDDIIYTNELAQARANYELKKAIAMYESIDLNSLPIDILSEGDIITVSDTALDLSEDRYIIQSINFPLRYDATCSMSVWKNRSLS